MANQVKALRDQFKDSKVCCYACAFEKVGLTNDILGFMLDHGYTAQQMRNQPALWKWIKTENFNQREKVLIRTCLIAVQDSQLITHTPIVHQGFLHMKDLEFKYSFNEYKIEMGSVQRGNVLQIYRKAESNDIVDNMMENLKKKFVETLPHMAIYGQIYQHMVDNYFVIDMKTGQRETGGMVKGKLYRKFFCPGHWLDLSLPEQWDDIRKSLHYIPRLKLFIVENVHLHDDTPTGVKCWLTFLKQSYPNQDDITLVVQVDYANFRSYNLDKKGVRAFMNHKVGVDDAAKMYWLDTSSTTDQSLGEDHARHSNLNLEIRAFKDGIF